MFVLLLTRRGTAWATGAADGTPEAVVSKGTEGGWAFFDKPAVLGTNKYI